MSDALWLALGLILVLEGLTYALVPRQMQIMMRMLQEQTPEQLRVMGAVVMALGVFVVWLVK
jgi:uncharacterized protein